MPDHEFMNAVQARAARICAGPSATRGQGPGVAHAVRRCLEKLPLRRFGTAQGTLFQRHLDEATEQLRRSLPVGSQNWGLARKLMNIFLRDALYTTYMADKFRIVKAEHLLELPLDSITTRWLRLIAGRGKLPRWRGVKHLTPQESAAYQAFAARHAAEQKEPMARVHLDTYWWGLRGD